MKRYISKIFLLSLALLALPFTVAMANPSPLGIEILKSTREDVAKKYKVIDEYRNKIGSKMGLYFYTQDLDIKNIDITGLKEARIISDKDGLIHSVFLTIHYDQLDVIYGALKNNYNLEWEDNNSSGNAEFSDEDSMISAAVDKRGDYSVHYNSNYIYKLLKESRKKEKEESKKLEKIL